ncbi:MAG: methylmalonyl-CoA mutase small subunit [Bacteroidales bacterium]|nr:methylmalonyl-CoA mutase small subunit [Bacteroidales bacterium]
MAENKEKLFDQFPPVSTEEWRAKVEVDLKGADFNKKLVWRTNEGFNVQPMYRAEDIKDLKTTDSLPGEYPFVRGTKTNNDWYIRQEIEVCRPKAANEKATEVLGKGVTSLGFKLKEDIDAEGLKTLLAGIDLAKVEVNFDCCPNKALQLAKDLVEVVKAAGAADTFSGSIGFDPFRRLLKHGKDFPKDIKALAAEIVKAVAEVKNLRVLAVNTDKLCNAGAYIYQELGYALSWGNEWLSQLTDAGIDATEAAKRIKFNMGISTNYFMEIAKFRAARMLWAQIVKQYEPKCDCACKMNVHATTSEFNQTIFDAYVNLLRSQTESMSAALAGVDSITVTPFDKQYKNPDEFSERLARNQQLLLKEESHLDKIVDPAGGSYYVETLTMSIANEAWKLFLATEEQGGFYAALKAGEVQKAVNESSDKRHTDVARRKESLLGTNQFPNFNEIANDKIECEGGKCCCGHNNDAEAETDAVEALKNTRAASEFEALRLETERSGKRPKVFMLTIGNLAMRLARSQFSANFFACAGYQIIDNLGFDTVEAGVEAAMEKQADVVVLCSSDDEYATLAPEAFKALAGRAEFVVAGAPACSDDLKAVGITEFVNVRSNVLETLKAFNAKLLK